MENHSLREGGSLGNTEVNFYRKSKVHGGIYNSTLLVVRLCNVSLNLTCVQYISKQIHNFGNLAYRSELFNVIISFLIGH
jgi:hypothetical protein